MKLIDKDALVAELKRKRDLHFKNYIEKGFESSEGKYDEDKYILSFINTLEVKEVDLEKEIESYWKPCDTAWCRDAYSMTHIRSMLSDIAKHFFELGLKAQKGE